MAKTIAFANANAYDEVNQYFADDYVRWPNHSSRRATKREDFKVQDAYPNLKTLPFGFIVDPDNPYRCYHFERWEGTNTQSLQIGPNTLPPTNKDIKLPTHIISLHWNPEGKVRYVCLSSPLDRFEENTNGAGAVFGRLAGAGVDIENASPGDTFLRWQQRVINAIGGFGINWSVESDIPFWWKIKSSWSKPPTIYKFALKFRQRRTIGILIISIVGIKASKLCCEQLKLEEI